MVGVRVVVCLRVRGPKTRLFYEEKLAFFGLRVRDSPNFNILIGVRSKTWKFGGFDVRREVTEAGPRAPVPATCIRSFNPTFCKN